MKNIVKICVKVITLLLITFLLLYSFSEFFRPNKLARPSDMTSKVDGFYGLEENTMDVLLFGTSHIFYGINPSILWRNNNINSYVFGGECQPLEITLAYMKESFKTQSPQLIILDVFGVSNSIESCRTDGSTKVNTEDLKLNQNKIDAASTYDMDMLFNIFDVAKYHNRLFEMDKKDFENGYSHFNNTNFGFTLAYPYGQYESYYEYSHDDAFVMPEKSKIDLLDEINNLCKENDSQLLLIKTPYYASDEDALIYNYIENYAKENEIEFINFNKLLSTIDYEFDFDGSTWHANVLGSMKLTSYLSNYINHNYNLDQSSDFYSNDYNNLYIKTEVAALNKITDLKDWIEIAKSLDGTIIVNYQGSDKLWLPDEQIQLLIDLGLDIQQVDKNQIILLDYNKQTREKSSEDIQFIINNHEIEVNTRGELIVDEKLMNSPETNLTLSIIDNSSGYIIDTISVSTVGDTYIFRK
ncbi:hypothetical protein SAMN02745191_1058 [Anaerorhabdus furcosa]|uniref:SGNH/GDSL hydrolase family protein n=2 Tax=Anaerorhabdus furcosa TaxID=118967 RepID=A0A1T4LVR9_9FIRM|nr:hypothetical protein SAMN02745191_1058 [Anaerorhabdus furcosa]